MSSPQSANREKSEKAGLKLVASNQLLSVNRRAHRVVIGDESRFWLNPFRHIPWDADIENQTADVHRPEIKTIGPFLWGRFTYSYQKPATRFTWINQLARTILTSWINILLFFIPAGLVLQYTKGPSPETFACCLIAEIPLWFLCDYSLEEIEKYIGVTASDLLDIITNNTVQLISSVLLLRADQVAILQTSLIGAILSNILVLLGLSLIFGGIKHHQQKFNPVGARGSSTLLSLATTSLLVPTSVKLLNQTSDEDLVRQSRGVAIILLLVYVSYTVYQMWTHAHELRHDGKGISVDLHHHNHKIQDEELGQAACAQDEKSDCPVTQRNGPSVAEEASMNDECTLHSVQDQEKGDPSPRPESEASPRSNKIQKGRARGQGRGRRWRRRNSRPEVLRLWGSRSGWSEHARDRTEIPGPQLHPAVAVLLFVATIMLLFFCVDATVGSISALTSSTPLSAMFVALILLPLPNCDFAPISMAVDDCVEQTMKYTVGRSIQTALLVEPLVIMAAWRMDVANVTLAFGGFEVVSLFTTILLLNFLVVDAKVHWIHGVLLLADWILIAIAAFFVSSDEVNGTSL